MLSCVCERLCGGIRSLVVMCVSRLYCLCASAICVRPPFAFASNCRRANVLRTLIYKCATVGVGQPYLSLHGAPKCGKTTLAMFAAFYASQRSGFPGFPSCVLVLNFTGDIRKGGEVGTAAEWAVIVRNRLVSEFGDRSKDALVVLDGCDLSEEELKLLPAMLSALSETHSRVRFVATSRSYLGVCTVGQHGACAPPRVCVHVCWSGMCVSMGLL